ncbi:DUF1885 family protein [Tepidibacillus infernus]|uniref:DUF1885 domain-containing protein n=1 Tax=Tepidibacillus decaturensis TaxID=1413211 RepID=A0A135L497_9BACI|nr:MULTISPECIES: DUF1885 family protein [Tepidibacillus]KXG43806.1 hypothetical protein U473_07105 [Tepidibacillus decaturensis]GBF11090.1 hypothetical protein HK1_01108 [Tepidibacillus sp. HK-1]
MGKSAYVKLVNGSVQQEITIDQVKELLNKYIENTGKLAEQLDWEYHESAFPYTIQEKAEGDTKYLYLKAKDELYNYLIIGVGSEEVDGHTTQFIQVVLPDEDYRTPGDQAKGNEFSKYLAKKLKAELHLFNGRVLYYNPRK